MKLIRAFFALCLLAPLFATAAAVHPDYSKILWYRQPAQVWTEALPVGNGRLGAMVFGGLAEERLQLNEDTLWTGQPRDYTHEGAAKHLPEIRRLLTEGKQKEAEALAMEKFMSKPLRQEMYQPMADLWIALTGHEAATDYRRQLDLSSAMASVNYRVGETRFTRTTFSSFPDQVLVQHIFAEEPGKVNGRIRLTSPQEGFTVKAEKNELHLTGKVSNGGLPFAVSVRVIAEGGTVEINGESLEVSGATAVTCIVAGASAYKRYDDISGDASARVADYLKRASALNFDELRKRHARDHHALFDRVRLDLGAGGSWRLPTDERLAIADKSGDPSLATLLFNYGRYLLIASSREGDQAANLQGIWNHHLVPPWGSKYTTNINAQMNYWPSEVANLTETNEALFRLIDEVRETGRRTAKVHYDAPGWVLHHNTDGWRGTAPINNSNHGIWPTGGAWFCLHLWEHYRFSRDKSFLAEVAYPVMKEASEFFVATLVTDPKSGKLISGPSNSPEHGGLVMGPTMDHQIIRGLFTWTAEAARIVKKDEAFAAKLDAMRAQIAPNQIGKHGQLQEWLEDRDDPADVHRHVSHLWGVFPGEDITWKTPELMRAARQSLLYRGDGGTGWSLGWKISLWARFLDGDHAHKILMNQLNFVREDPAGSNKGPGGTYPNLFDAHPPFQIDGNFAATAGICEMLVQSHTGDIVLLPALPSAWPTGAISGLRARGGAELKLSWEHGKLKEVSVSSAIGGKFILRCGEQTTEVLLEPQKNAMLGADLKPLKI
ncbi:glycoside hydrolase family 95 protein [Oleiharenicola lentus]|uniref:glycoside hydrolase family 95 protein n=1 Tax=Oleiharenicola lentus TaxID=2508720 RepID=UPI003F6790C4